MVALIQPVARLPDGQTVAYWTAEAVWQRLQEAARTLKALPATGCFPHNGAIWWPDVVRSFWDIWNSLDDDDSRKRYADDRNRAKVAPLPSAITAMDEALRWLGWIQDRRQIRALWGLALGARPGRVARELGVHRSTLAGWKREALDRIVRRLNAT